MRIMISLVHPPVTCPAATCCGCLMTVVADRIFLDVCLLPPGRAVQVWIPCDSDWLSCANQSAVQRVTDWSGFQMADGLRLDDDKHLHEVMRSHQVFRGHPKECTMAH